MSYFLDHKVNNEGNLRLKLPELVINYLNQYSVLDEIPLEVFIYNIELIALNEDVKYHTLGNKNSAVGRRNNLATIIGFIIFYLLNEISENRINYIEKLIQGRGVARYNHEVLKTALSL